MRQVLAGSQCTRRMAPMLLLSWISVVLQDLVDLVRRLVAVNWSGLVPSGLLDGEFGHRRRVHSCEVTVAVGVEEPCVERGADREDDGDEAEEPAYEPA